MKVLETTSSLQVYGDSLLFSEAACLARPDTESLASEITPLIETLDALEVEKTKNRRDRVRAQARAAMADAAIDKIIRRILSDALALTEQKRDVPWFGNLFFGTLVELIRPALTRQIAIAEDLLERLGDPGVPASLRQSHEAALKSAIDNGKAADVKRKELRRQQRLLRVREAELKQKVNQVRTTVYGKLLHVAGGKAEAEKLFPPPQRIASDDEEEDDDGSETPPPGAD